MKAKIVALIASGLFGARIWVIPNKWDHKTCLDVRGRLSHRCSTYRTTRWWGGI